MNESAEDLERLKRIIDASAAGAGPAMRANFTHPGWVMTAEEFVAFWGTSGRMASVSTPGAAGGVHAAVLEVTLVAGRLVVPTFPDAVRLRDHAADSRCVIASWDGAYTAVTVYGRATYDDARSAGMVRVTVDPKRIFAIKAPAGHHFHRTGEMNS